MTTIKRNKMILIRQLIICITLVHLLSNNIYAQLSEGKDTLFLRNNYEINFHPLYFPKDSILLASIFQSTEKINNQFPYSQILRDQDSIVNFLKPAVTFHFDSYQWDTTFMFCNKIICRNGMQLIFQNGVIPTKYYPNRDVIVLGNSNYIFNLTTGEDDFEIRFTDNLSKKVRIVGIPYNSESNEILSLLLQEKSNNNFRTILDFREILDQYDNYYYRNSYCIINERLYLSVGDNWWEITVKKHKKKT